MEWDACCLKKALDTKVVCPGSDDSRLVSWGHSAVGVGNQVWDSGQGSSVRQGWGKGWHSLGNGGWGDGGSNQARARSDSSVESGSLGGQVVSPGGHNRWGVSWGHG